MFVIYTHTLHTQYTRVIKPSFDLFFPISHNIYDSTLKMGSAESTNRSEHFYADVCALVLPSSWHSVRISAIFTRTQNDCRAKVIHQFENVVIINYPIIRWPSILFLFRYIEQKKNDIEFVWYHRSINCVPERKKRRK